MSKEPIAVKNPDSLESRQKAPSGGGTKLVKARLFYKQSLVLYDPLRFVSEQIAKYGDFVRYQGLFRCYIINDPELIAQVFKQTFKQFNKESLLYRRFNYVLGNSLIMAEGAHWKRQRKLLSPTFNQGNIKSYFTQIKQNVEQFLSHWEVYTQSKEEFSFSKEMNVLSLKISGKLLFSQSFEEHAAEIQKWVKVINYYSARPPVKVVTHPDFPRPLNYKMKSVMKLYSCDDYGAKKCSQ